MPQGCKLAAPRGRSRETAREDPQGCNQAAFRGRSTVTNASALAAAVALLLSAAALAGGRAAATRDDVGWPVYRGDPQGTQYAPLAQIHAANVHRLQPVWEYRTRDATERSTMHVNPVVVNGVMYVTTPSLKAVALDAASGRDLWTFDPAKHNNGTVVRLRN